MIMKNNKYKEDKKGWQKLVKNFKPVFDCVINEYFINSKNAKELRLKYCRKNCFYKCLRGLSYKKRGNE